MSNRRAIMAGLTIGGICPRMELATIAQVAEVLACCEQDPDLRRAHRRAKLDTFPEADRDLIRQTVNAVLTARSNP